MAFFSRLTSSSTSSSSSQPKKQSQKRSQKHSKKRSQKRSDQSQKPSQELETTSYQKIQKALQALQNYRPPRDVYIFSLVAYLLGMSTVHFYEYLTTPGSRQALWDMMRIIWKNKMKDIAVSKSKWNHFKNRIYNLVNGKTRQLFNQYEKNIDGALDSLVKFYHCLLSEQIIKSTQTEQLRLIIDIIDDTLEQPKQEQEQKEEEQKEQPSSRPMDDSLALFSKAPISLFGKRFKKNKISTLGILLYVISVGYAQNGSPPLLNAKGDNNIRCQHYILKLDNYLNEAEQALVDLKDQRGAEKLKLVKDIWSKLKIAMLL